MALLPMTASLRRFGVKFGDVTIVLLIVLVASSDMRKQDTASTKKAVQNKAGKSVMGKEQLQVDHRQYQYLVISPLSVFSGHNFQSSVPLWWL